MWQTDGQTDTVRPSKTCMRPPETFDLYNRYIRQPRKCKQMVATNSCTAFVPIFLNIERIETFNFLLGIIVSNDLKWNPHIAYIIHKANWRLHFTRQLKRAAVSEQDMLHFYIGVIRPVRCCRLAHRSNYRLTCLINLKQHKMDHSISYLAVQFSPINRMNLFVLMWKFYHYLLAEINWLLVFFS